MEATVAESLGFSKNDRDDIFQDVAPFFSSQDPSKWSRKSLLERGKPDDKDALQAVKLDPAVLEAQVTVDATRQAEELQPDAYEMLAAKKKVSERSYPSFDEVLSSQHAALLGLTPQQLALLVTFVDTLRAQRLHTQRHLECAFCRNSGAAAAWMAPHALRDRRRRVRCPLLRALACPRCGATGDRAHTLKYCPLNMFEDSWSY